MSSIGPKFGVILSGCGVFDGAEVYESVLTLLAIDRAGGEALIYAPNINQRQTINHQTGSESEGETRNVMVEAARIARGPVRDLASFSADDVDILIMPGGFGAAKNLSTFAFDGPDCTVNEDVAAAVKAVRAAGKPIGALCIAPVILAKVFGEGELTIGQAADVSGAIEAMGATHKITSHGEVIVDHNLSVVTSPCYMLDSTVSQIAAGTENAVKALIELHAGIAAKAA